MSDCGAADAADDFDFAVTNACAAAAPLVFMSTETAEAATTVEAAGAAAESVARVLNSRMRTALPVSRMSAAQADRKLGTHKAPVRAARNTTPHMTRIRGGE